MKWALTLIVLFTCARCGAQLTTVDSVGNVSALSHAEAAKSPPADFEATVTYFRDYEHTLFVQDGTDAIYVYATTGLRLVQGDRIRIRGVVQDSFRPVVVSSNLTLLHHGNPPQPVPADFVSMIHSLLDCRYVTVRGTVISAYMTLSSGRSITGIDLRVDGGMVSVIMDNDDSSHLKSLLDAEVEITGALSGRFDGKMQQTGLLVHTMSFDRVKIIRRAQHDAWSVPLTPMDDVLRNSNVDDHTQRVRVQGSLTYYRQTSMAVLQDGDHSIRVLTPQIERLRIGDRVEAIGIPYVENDFLTLKLGQIRSTGSKAPVEPRPVNWDQLASGKYAFNLVSIDGTVVSQVREHSQDVYVISSGNNVFSATVRHSFLYTWNVPVNLPAMPEIKPGSKVRITGVVVLDTGNPFNGATAFGILLRSASDVVVLSPPSWVTVTNLSRLVNVLLLVVAFFAIWSAVLKRQVHGRTTELATRIQAEAVLERRRSQILEDINGPRPMRQVLEQIANLVSFNLDGAPCWFQIGARQRYGSFSPQANKQNIIRQEIPSRSDRYHGELCANLDVTSPLRARAPEALSMGAWLATLLIENRSMYADLVHRSEFDLLTDIHNRFSLERQIDKLITRACSESKLEGYRFGLIYVDLDKFKQVNDLYGHRIGDLYLQAVAQRMKRQLRPGDVLSRLGGDEFAALVAPVRDRREAQEIADRLERCFEEPFVLDGASIPGSASVGIALYPEDGKSRDALFTRADAAMYAVKHGRPAEPVSADRESGHQGYPLRRYRI